MKKYYYFLCVVLQSSGTIPQFINMEIKSESKITSHADIQSICKTIKDDYQKTTKDYEKLRVSIVNYKLLREE